MAKTILGLIGSYRNEGVVATLVEETLAEAARCGAATEAIYLNDQNIEFCTNCRACTQEPGEARGACALWALVRRSR